MIMIIQRPMPLNYEYTIFILMLTNSSDKSFEVTNLALFNQRWCSHKLPSLDISRQKILDIVDKRIRESVDKRIL